MHILAAFLDPNNNGLDVTDVATLVGIVLAVAGALAGVQKWNAKRVAEVRTRERADMERRIKAAVTEATMQIQPDYRNGGATLRDLGDKLDVVIERQGHIADRLDKHIDWHLDKGE
jgi:hypothetical protein